MTRFERKGLKLLALKMTQLSDELLEKWYEHHKDRIFVELKNFMKWTRWCYGLGRSERC